MFEQKKVKSAVNVSNRKSLHKKSKNSDNLYVSPSFLHKFDKPSTRKSKSRFSSKSPITTDDKPSPTIPRNAAAHFGNFYGLQEKATEGRRRGPEVREPARSEATPRLEFTRQMVHKLERLAGTGEYARQVSALLEETVEPPNFRLCPLPAEDSIPNGRHDLSGYPLWYKEPYKMPLSSSDAERFLAEKYENMILNSRKAKDVFNDESSGEGVDEESSGNECGDDEREAEKRVNLKYSTKEPNSIENTSSTRSSPLDKTKNIK